MATYVLVHGGGHGGWCYQRVARLCRPRATWSTCRHDGPGRTGHLLNAEVDLHRHIEDIAAVLEFEDLRDVILVGHSYGGMVITGAADRVAGAGGPPGLPRCRQSRQRAVARRCRRPVINAVRPFGEVRDGMELVSCRRPMPACSTA